MTLYFLLWKVRKSYEPSHKFNASVPKANEHSESSFLKAYIFPQGQLTLYTHTKHLINFIFSLCQENKQLASMEARGNMKGTVWDKETKVNKNKPEQQTSSHGHPRNRKSSSRVMTCAVRHIEMRLSTPKDNIYTEKLCAECQYHKVICLPVITSKFHQIRVK